MGTHHRTIGKALKPHSVSPATSRIHRPGAGTSPGAAVTQGGGPPPVGGAGSTTGPPARSHSPEWGVGGPARSRGRVESDDEHPRSHPRSTTAGGVHRPGARHGPSRRTGRTWGPWDKRASGGTRELGASECERAGVEAAQCDPVETDRKARITRSYDRSLAAPSGASASPGQRTPTTGTLCERVYK
jgi:hypothetical protein